MGHRVAGAFAPICLDDLDRHASLQRRIDHKYLIDGDLFERLAAELARDHRVLEIDSERMFEYESTYFDTPDLTCFHDHLEDREPRYKVRTRLYATTGSCSFEVKVKRDEGETAKHGIDYPAERRHEVDDRARQLLDETLEKEGIGQAPEALPATLITRFERMTLAAADTPARLTVDSRIVLSRPEGGAVALRHGHLLLETKTPEGDGPADRLLRDAGATPISVSKYRLGIGMLVAPEAEPEYATDVKPLFDRRPE